MHSSLPHTVAVLSLTINSAAFFKSALQVKLDCSENSVEGDPVAENRKVINLREKAGRLKSHGTKKQPQRFALETSGQQLQCSWLSIFLFSLFPPCGSFILLTVLSLPATTSTESCLSPLVLLFILFLSGIQLERCTESRK